MSITSDEVNYLVYRYLVESGFSHTSFAFQYETCIHLQDKANVVNGQLIQLLQKGLLFTQDGTERKCQAPFTLLGPHECIYKDTSLKKKKKKKENEAPDIKAENVKVLKGHKSEVFVCSWNPQYPLIATGSGDGCARIWNVPDEPREECESIILHHSEPGAETKDVTTLEWNPDGELLATGSYDGLARIWKRTGEIVFKMDKHIGPIFSLKWNRTGNLLLSGGVDKSSIVWDISTGEARQQFIFHSGLKLLTKGPCLDVDWKDDVTFATSSADKKINVCQLGSLAPLKQFLGHKDEVNSIRWDPSGKYLASCSDDRSAKVWTLEQDEPVWDLSAHGKEIYTIRWCPSKINADGSLDKLWLATASFDGGIRLWDVKSGNCIYTLSQHSEAVYTVSYTPDCSFLASGSYDKNVYIWSMKDGSLLRKYTGLGGVFEIGYSPDGTKLAACFADKKLVILYVDNEDLD